MATRQRVFVAVTPIPEVQLDELRAVLASVDRRTGTAPFTNLRTTHFLRWTILQERQNPEAGASSGEPRKAGDGRPFGPALLLTSVFDGSRRKHLSELAAVLQDELREIYGAVVSGADRWSGEQIVKVVRRGSSGTNLYFNGTHLRTRDQIDLERTGWAWIQRELELPLMGFVGDPLSWIRRRMNDDDAPDWMRRWKRGPAFPIRPRPVLEILLVLAILAGLTAFLAYRDAGSVVQSVRLGLSSLLTAVALLFIVAGIVHAALFRMVAEKERQELESEPPPPSYLPDNTADGDPSEREIGSELNEITHLAPIKPGWIRLWTLWVVLFWLNLVARLFAARAMNLGGITTIHFGYWTIIGKPRRLLFVSHYDGTFENYLHDFALLGTHYGVNAIWSNCVGFPQTRRVFRGGARERVRRFVEFGRAFQHATQVWFRAYPNLPAVHINRNTLVREGVLARLRWIGIRRWDSAEKDWMTLKRMT
ncbi:MAG: hypothetical protein WEG36_03630 [Gemmatimonadota bacterium]